MVRKCLNRQSFVGSQEVREVVLDSLFVGGVRYTTVKSIDRFLGTPTQPLIDEVAQADVEAALRAAGP